MKKILFSFRRRSNYFNRLVYMIVQTVLGGKNMSKNKVKPLVTAVFASTLFLSGCGLFGKEVQKKVDPPNQVTETKTNPTKETTGQNEEVEGTKTELYLINKDGLVVP